MEPALELMEDDLRAATRKLAIGSNDATSVGRAAGSISTQRRFFAKQAPHFSDGTPAAIATLSPLREAACISVVP